MIVDTMSWDEIGSYFDKLGIEFKKKYLNYIKRCLKCDRYLKQPKDIISYPLRKFDMGNNDKVFLIRFIREDRNAGVMLFSPFRYKGKQYFARLVPGEKHTVCFSLHSMKRYYERFEKIEGKDINLDEDSVADVLIYNDCTVAKPIKTIYKNKSYILFTCNDGAFLGYRKESISILNTFITKEMMHLLQSLTFQVANKILTNLTLSERAIAV